MKQMVKLFPIILLILLLASIAGCQRQEEIPAPLETTDKSDGSATDQPEATLLRFGNIEKKLFSDYDSVDPMLVIITQAEEHALLDGWVSTNVGERLRKLDYGAYFAVGVFQGRQPTNGYAVYVYRVEYIENRVLVYAHFKLRDPEYGANDIVTSPYHLVKVPKGELQGMIEFSLIVDEQEIFSTERRILP